LTLAAFFWPSAPLLADLAKLKISVFPITEAALLHLAQRQGFFAAYELEVELVEYQSAHDSAEAAAGQGFDGHLGNLGSVILQRANQLPFMVVATVSHSNSQQRGLGLVSSPLSEAKTLEALKGRKLGSPTLGVADYYVFRHLEATGPDHFEKVRLAHIGERYQALMEGRIEAALLAEPWLTRAEKAGGTVVWDDRDLSMPVFVVALNANLPHSVINAFQTSLFDSATWINEHPAETRAALVDLSLLPPDMAASYDLPRMNPAEVPWRLPSQEHFDDFIAWLRARGALDAPGEDDPDLPSAPRYEEVVYPSGGER
jgi:NitT/TauT family transport system substrate-binding protein